MKSVFVILHSFEPPNAYWDTTIEITEDSDAM